MIRELRISIMVLLVLSCLTGMIYPVTVTVMAHLLFPDQSNGSLIMIKDRVVGSRLIGQSFTSPKYFWGRLSATSPVPYNAAASGGSNYGPMHPDLMKAAETRIANLLNGGPRSSLIPVDLVTASGSGLDPHISIAAANFQVTRIARARNISVEFVQRLIRQHTEGRQFGLLGEPRVNVLNLNLALDRLRNQE